MNTMQILRDEYPGDSAWESFVSVFEDDWNFVSDKERYLKTFGKKDLAIVLSTKMGERSLNWFENINKALDSHSPRSVLELQPEGEKIIRTLLMRTP